MGKTKAGKVARPNSSNVSIVTVGGEVFQEEMKILSGQLSRLLLGYTPGKVDC